MRVAREPFVDKRVIGVQQVQGAAVFAENALEQQFGLALEGLLQFRIGGARGVLHFAQEQPLSREIPDQRVGTRVAQHAAP